MAHAKIVSVGPVKDVLSWVEGVYGQFRIAIVGEADLLKAWEAGTAFMVVIEEGIETCNLHTRMRRSMLLVQLLPFPPFNEVQ